jgi:SAM-dependent methyltransferase
MRGTTLLSKVGKAIWQGRPFSLPRLGTATGVPDQDVLTERWDREWIVYLNSEDPRPFLLPHTSLTLAADISSLSAQQVHATRLTKQIMPLHIYMPGSRLVGANVVEVGCGPGLLCKQLGLIASRVVGIDHSTLALHIARLVSPPTCTYCHSSQLEKLEPLHNTFECMVSRYFFIHQNWDNALQVLRLAHQLLRLGGMVGADFLMPDPAQELGVVFRAKSSLSRKYPSCGFVFTLSEIEELAAATGFRIVDKWESFACQRRFVMLARQ